MCPTPILLEKDTKICARSGLAQMHNAHSKTKTSLFLALSDLEVLLDLDLPVVICVDFV